jgi:hypothetical protein
MCRRHRGERAMNALIAERACAMGKTAVDSACASVALQENTCDLFYFSGSYVRRAAQVLVVGRVHDEVRAFLKEHGHDQGPAYEEGAMKAEDPEVRAMRIDAMACAVRALLQIEAATVSQSLENVMARWLPELAAKIHTPWTAEVIELVRPWPACSQLLPTDPMEPSTPTISEP